jgi:hypothetical protein
MGAIIPDDPNPTGITSYDHELLGDLPEYWEASRALHHLRAVMAEVELDMSWDEWLATVHAIVAAPFFVDVCPKCLGSRVPPYAAEVVADRLSGSYRCIRCGHDWSCSWVTWAPSVPAAEPIAVALTELPYDIPGDHPRGDAA